METKKTRRLGELLVESALITEQQLAIALDQQKLEHLPLGDILIKNGFCKDIDIAHHAKEILNRHGHFVHSAAQSLVCSNLLSYNSLLVHDCSLIEKGFNAQ